MPVWLTHAAPRGARLAEQLQHAAPEVEWISLPSATVHNLLLGHQAPQLPLSAWLVLTSPSTIDAIVQAWGKEWLGRHRLLVVGPGSAHQALFHCPQARVFAPQVAPFDAQAAAALWHRERALEVAPPPTELWVFGGESSQTDWTTLLASPGSYVRLEAAVRTEPSALSPLLLRALSHAASEAPYHYWVMTSRQSVSWTGQVLDALEGPLGDHFRRHPVLALHEVIAREAQANGFTRVEVLEPGQAALIQRVRGLLSGGD
jgi:uroporphyrinogen-III synthase